MMQPAALVNDLGSSQPVVAPPKKVLDKDAFMQLLIAQLRNQDPYKATDDREFIAQLAQFSSLEQTQQMTQNLSALLSFQQLTQGSALIGRQVEVLDPVNGLPVQGTVSEIRLTNGIPRIGINDQLYDMSAIQRLL